MKSAFHIYAFTWENYLLILKIEDSLDGAILLKKQPKICFY